jgi:hypothetical protein
VNKFAQHAGERCGRSLFATSLLRILLFVGVSSAALAVRAADPDSTAFEGTVVVQVEDDFAHERAHTRYFLLDRRSNERLELQLSPQQAKRIRFGQELRVRGKQDGKSLAVDPDTDAVAVLTEQQKSLVAPDLTPRRVITLILDITDASANRYTVSDRCDESSEQLLADHMFGSRQIGRLNVDGCYRDSSYGVLGFGGRSYPGTTMDVVRVDITEPSPALPGVCNYELWALNADAAAVAQGIDLSAYQHRMYVLPAATTACDWGGLGQVGCGESCRAWARTTSDLVCGYPDILAHELGHNIGLWHARTASIDATGACTYCDTSDFMGFGQGNLRALNAPHKDYLGWLGGGRIVDGAAGGAFTISALGMQDPPSPQAVKIVPASGFPYWLSYRAPIGYDAQLEPRYFNQLHIHRSEYGGDSFLVRRLVDGETHVDGNLNLTVRQVSHTADSATFDVQYGPSFTLDAGSLEFGSQLLNLPASVQRITLLSNGGTALPITSIAIGGANADQYAQANNCGTSVAPGASCAIEVAFKPTSAGSKVATLSVTAAGGAGTRAASLSGTGAESAFTLSPPSLNFSPQPVQVTSSAQTIILRSTGIRALPITSIVIGGIHSGDYAQTNNCGTSVAVGASCAINVTFKPTNGGRRDGELIVTGGNGAAVQSVGLMGSGVRAAYTLSTTALEFGNQLLNVASSAQTITLRSTGIVALPITSIAISGTNPTDFPHTNNCGTSVAVGASCTINVTFKPTSAGPKIALLTVTASGGAGVKQRVLFTGNGVRVAYTLSTTSLVFGNQPLNLASSAKTITLRSTGVATLPITSIAIGGSNANQFAQTNTCGTSLAAGASCAIKVTFKPTGTGQKVATLSVTAGGGAAKSASLSGTGVRSAYTLSTTSLVFGNQPLNLVSSGKTITLLNTGGTVLPIASISIGGTTPGQFAQTNTCGTSVAAGGSCAINVTFKPTSTGSKAATLSVVAAGGAGIKSATLSGTGARSTFAVSPTALGFGNLTRNATSSAKTVRISNTGVVVLPISSIVVAGTNPGQFIRTHNCPARVAVGGSCTASVVFKPTSTGAKSAILQVIPGGGAALRSVALSGTGT